MSGRHPHRSKPVSILSRLPHSTLVARYQRLLIEYDRMCGKVMVEQAEIRRMSRASGRILDRMIAAEKRAKLAESALSAATSRPASCVRLLLRAERLLYRLSYDRCPSCGLGGISHRYNCRLNGLIAAIQREMPV